MPGDRAVLRDQRNQRPRLLADRVDQIGLDWRLERGGVHAAHGISISIIFGSISISRQPIDDVINAEFVGFIRVADRPRPKPDHSQTATHPCCS